jgi:hypothetical protein
MSFADLAKADGPGFGTPGGIFGSTSGLCGGIFGSAESTSVGGFSTAFSPGLHNPGFSTSSFVGESFTGYRDPEEN